MTKRRTLAGVIILMAALAVIIYLTVIRPGANEVKEETLTDVAVRVGKIIRTTLHRYVMGYGSVEPEPAADGKPPAAASIASPVSGLLVQINCTEGSHVSQGETLFRLDSRLAEVAVLKAQKELQFAEQTFERQKNLLTADGTSQKSYQEAELQLNAARSGLSAAQTQLALLQITSPLTGTLVRLNATLGQSVESNTVLAEVVDMNRLVAAARVPSREASLLKPGQPVELGTGEKTIGTLSFVGKDIDPMTDTVLVRAFLPVQAGFRPGQFLNIRIICEEHRDCLAVPEESLVSSEEEGSWIMIVRGDKAVRQPVIDGFRERGLVEVSGEGLAEGMIIVTTDAYSLPPETRIHIVSQAHE
jgi:membrane fusion protein (multidrug efflux system)